MELLSRAISLHRAGRLAEAGALYREILAREPDHAEALQLLGLVACQSARLEQAEELIARAVALQPDNAEFLGNLGEVQRRRNRLPEAIAALRRAAELAPQNACVPYNLALALSAVGQLTEAVAAYRQALVLQPNYPEALNNLGLLLHRLGEYPAAAEAFQKALALRPDHAEDSNNLGLTLWNLHRHEAALAAFELAVQLKPDFAGAQANRALALRKLGRAGEAVGAYEKAARLNPNSADLQRDRATALSEVRAFEAAIGAARRAVELAPEQAEAAHCLGVVLAAAADQAGGAAGEAAAGRKAEAIGAYERALALRPGVAEWEFELAVLRGDTPPTAPDAYVKALFDEYALRFEHHLVDLLHYDVPQKLLAALRETGVLPAVSDPAAPAAALDILDLGSGTGLVGSLFRPYARSLTAVDLSPNMMAAAQGRRDAGGRLVYDRLITSHILPALRVFRAAFDLILAADVFIYVGSLDEVLPAAARALRPNGTLAFSLERFDPPAAGDAGFDFRLRYRHSLAYIRGLAAAAGLTERAVVEAHLRDDVPPGWIVVLQRGA